MFAAHLNYSGLLNCRLSISNREQYNIIDALLSGAANTLKICGYLIANLIAFISVLNFLDVTISWLFSLVHHPEVNFQYLLGLIFYPFAVIVGIPLRDCMLSSKLIGIKVSLNEVSTIHAIFIQRIPYFSFKFIAYGQLGEIRKLRDALIANNTFPLYLNGDLTLPNDTPMLWDVSKYQDFLNYQSRISIESISGYITCNFDVCLMWFVSN